MAEVAKHPDPKLSDLSQIDISRRTLEAVQSLPIEPIPSNGEITPRFEEIQFIGEIPIIRASWGTHITTEQKIEAFNQAGLPQKLIDTVNGLGFAGGYHLPVETKIFSDEVQNSIANIATELIHASLTARGWDGADRLYLASTTITNETAERVVEQLSRRGITVDDLRKVRMACESPIASLIHALNDPAMQGKRCVVGSVETLSGDMTDPSNPGTFCTFGDGGGAIPFIPGEEIQKLGGQTRIYRNTSGSFTVPVGTNRSLQMPRLPIPSEYQLLNNPAAAEHFHYTGDGMVLDILEGTQFEMIGNSMLPDFIAPKDRISVPEIVVDMADQYEAVYGRSDSSIQYSSLATPTGHQPSLGVMEPMNRRILEVRLSKSNIPREEILAAKKSGSLSALCEEKGINVKAIQFPWRMRETGANNMSAGTWLYALGEQARLQEVVPGTDLLLMGLGVGLSDSVHVIRMNNQ